MAHALSLAGRASEAVTLLEKLASPSTRRNAFTGQRDVLYLSDAYLRVGRLDEALRTGQRALDVARISSQRGREAWALRLLGDIGTARRETDDALRHYGHALALGTELGMRPLAAHCHLGLRALYQRTGRREQAQKHLTTAAAMYREMDMRFYLEQAEAR